VQPEMVKRVVKSTSGGGYKGALSQRLKTWFVGGLGLVQLKCSENNF